MNVCVCLRTGRKKNKRKPSSSCSACPLILFTHKEIPYKKGESIYFSYVVAALQLKEPAVGARDASSFVCHHHLFNGFSICTSHFLSHFLFLRDICARKVTKCVQITLTNFHFHRTRNFLQSFKIHLQMAPVLAGDHSH